MKYLIVIVSFLSIFISVPSVAENGQIIFNPSIDTAESRLGRVYINRLSVGESVKTSDLYSILCVIGDKINIVSNFPIILYHAEKDYDWATSYAITRNYGNNVSIRVALEKTIKRRSRLANSIVYLPSCGIKKESHPQGSVEFFSVSDIEGFHDINSLINDLCPRDSCKE